MTLTSFQSISPHSAYFQSENKRPTFHVAGSSAHTSITSSALYQRQCQLDDDWLHRLDQTEILGGYNDDEDQIGHTGCVNALSWSPSGQLLASAGDDRNVLLWKLGSADHHPVATQSCLECGHHNLHPSNRHSAAESVQTDTDPMQPIVQPWSQRSFPNLGMGMLGKIQTGHRANIFSVKWAPNMNDRRLFTGSGDHQARVFDINYLSTGYAGDGTPETLADGSEYTNWDQSSSGACIRIFRCHSNRIKRIDTEISPDVFLTCGDDGEVRQMDVRAHHRCSANRRYGQGCPAPLAHFRMGLYSLSVSKTEPWLFAVAGRSSHVYLQDRRMIPHLLLRDWGMVTGSHNVQAAEQEALSMCVRRFSIPLGGFERAWLEEDENLVRVPFRKPDNRHQLSDGQRGRLLRNPIDLSSCLSHNYDYGVHVTACKINESTGRDIVVSYSGGAIYRFGLYDEADVFHHQPSMPTYPRRLKAERENRKSSRESKKQKWQDRFQPYIDSMKRRVLQFLFPLPTVSRSDARRKAFWDDIRDLRQLLGNPDSMKRFTNDYCAVELCSVLGHMMHMELLSKPESQHPRPTGSSSLHPQPALSNPAVQHQNQANPKQIPVTDKFRKPDDCSVVDWLCDIATNFKMHHEDQETSNIAFTLGSLQFEAAPESLNVFGYERLKHYLWDQARDVFKVIWKEVSDALPSRPIYPDEECIRKYFGMAQTVQTKYLSNSRTDTGLTQHPEPSLSTLAVPPNRSSQPFPAASPSSNVTTTTVALTSNISQTGQATPSESTRQDTGQEQEPVGIDVDEDDHQQGQGQDDQVVLPYSEDYDDQDDDDYFDDDYDDDVSLDEGYDDDDLFIQDDYDDDVSFQDDGDDGVSCEDDDEDDDDDLFIQENYKCSNYYQDCHADLVEFEDGHGNHVDFEGDDNGHDDDCYENDVVNCLEEDAVWYEEMADDLLCRTNDTSSYSPLYLYDENVDQVELEDEDYDIEIATDAYGTLEGDTVEASDYHAHGNSYRQGRSPKPSYTLHSNTPTVYPRNMYTGHVNIATLKDVNFVGRDDRYVVSGSDDRNWFLWDTETSELKGIWEADDGVVNTLEPHPSLPVIAVSGIEETIKLFTPVTLTSNKPDASDDSSSSSFSTWDDNDDELYKISDRFEDKKHIAHQNLILNAYNQKTRLFGDMQTLLFGH